jgi:hypothetical protein
VNDAVLAAAETGATPRRRSRAATGFPLITVTILAAAVLLGGSAVGPAAFIAAVAFIQAALVLSWVLGIGLPGRIGAVLIALAAAGAADAVLGRWHEHGYQPVVAVLGLAIPVMFVHQLTRGVVRARVVESLSDIALLVLAVSAIAGLIVLRYQSDGERTVLAVVGATTLALVLAQLTDLVFPVLRFDPLVERGLPAVVLGVVGGAVVGQLALHTIVDFAGARAAFAGAAVAAVACLLAVGASFVGAHSTLSPSAVGDGEVPVWAGVARLRPVASALIVVALASPAGYVLVNALGS